jgi:hypothetical protein
LTILIVGAAVAAPTIKMLFVQIQLYFALAAAAPPAGSARLAAVLQARSIS